MKKLLLIPLLLNALFLAGCETLSPIGQDIKEATHVITTPLRH